MLAGRERCGTRWKFHVGNKTYTTASLRREWAHRTPMLDKHCIRECDQYIPITDSAISTWYIAAAWATGSLIKRKLFPANATSLQQVIDTTQVLVGRSDFLQCTWQRSQHVYMTVYFQHKHSPELINAVPKSLCGAASQVAVSYTARLKQQYRQAIDSQITQFRQSKTIKGFMKCRQCKRVGAGKEYYIDHGVNKHSFADLMQDYLNSIDIAHNSQDAVTGWQSYHRKHAKLCVLCAECNLKQGRYGKKHE